MDTQFSDRDYTEHIFQKRRNARVTTIMCNLMNGESSWRSKLHYNPLFPLPSNVDEFTDVQLSGIDGHSKIPAILYAIGLRNRLTWDVSIQLNKMDIEIQLLRSVLEDADLLEEFYIRRKIHEEAKSKESEEN